MKITVIIAVLNRVDCLERCLNSVFFQTYVNVELIIIDGGSQDGTLEIIKNKSDQIDYWDTREDRGIYHAWNKALRKAKGDWIIFMGSDDWLWSEDSLEKAANYLSKAKQDQLIFYGDVIGHTSNAKKVGPLTAPWSYRKYLDNGMLFSHQGAFHSSIIFSKYGVFDENYKIAGDYELLLRVVKDVSPVYMKDVVVSGMALTGISHQDNNSLLMYKEYVHAQKKNGLKAPNLGLRFCLVKSKIKNMLYAYMGNEGTGLLLHIYRSFTGRRKQWKE